MTWLWWLALLPLASICAGLGWAARAAVEQPNRDWETQDHEQLAFTLGFLVGAGEIEHEDVLIDIVFQLPVSAKRR